MILPPKNDNGDDGGNYQTMMADSDNVVQRLRKFINLLYRVARSN
jgi:hypothetical protein